MQRHLEVNLFYQPKLDFWLGSLMAVEFSMKISQKLKTHLWNKRKQKGAIRKEEKG